MLCLLTTDSLVLYFSQAQMCIIDKMPSVAPRPEHEAEAATVGFEPGTYELLVPC